MICMTCSIAACGKSGGKKWIVATDTVFRPFEFTNENGEFVGIDVIFWRLSQRTRDLSMNCRALAGMRAWQQYSPVRHTL